MKGSKGWTNSKNSKRRTEEWIEKWENEMNFTRTKEEHQEQVGFRRKKISFEKGYFNPSGRGEKGRMVARGERGKKGW